MSRRISSRLDWVEEGLYRGWIELWVEVGFHLHTLTIYTLGFKQDFYTLTLILRMKIVLCSKFS